MAVRPDVDRRLPGDGPGHRLFRRGRQHYAVTVEVCPPRRGNHKGVVEKANHAAAQRIWRSMPDTVDGRPITVEQAQARFDTWCQAKGDARPRVMVEPDGTHRRTTVGDLAAAEPLRPLPTPFPVTTSVERVASAQALVSYAGNFYCVAPELARARVIVSVVHGADHLHIAPAASPAAVVAWHRIVASGTGATVRDDHHVSALNTAAMTAASSEHGVPHRHKRRVPPGPAAVAAAETLQRRDESVAAIGTEPTAGATASAAVVDPERYAAIAAGRNTLTA